MQQFCRDDCYLVLCNRCIVFILFLIDFITLAVNRATLLKEFDCLCMNMLLEEILIVFTWLLYSGHCHQYLLVTDYHQLPLKLFELLSNRNN
jgi:hypothetical protein